MAGYLKIDGQYISAKHKVTLCPGTDAGTVKGYFKEVPDITTYRDYQYNDDGTITLIFEEKGT